MPVVGSVSVTPSATIVTTAGLTALTMSTTECLAADRARDRDLGGGSRGRRVWLVGVHRDIGAARGEECGREHGAGNETGTDIAAAGAATRGASDSCRRRGHGLRVALRLRLGRRGRLVRRRGLGRRDGLARGCEARRRPGGLKRLRRLSLVRLGIGVHGRIRWLQRLECRVFVHAGPSFGPGRVAGASVMCQGPGLDPCPDF